MEDKKRPAIATRASSQSDTSRGHNVPPFIMLIGSKAIAAVVWLSLDRVRFELAETGGDQGVGKYLAVILTFWFVYWP
jgi:hypothetical protein